MDEQLVEKSGRKKYITERNGEAPGNGKELSHPANAKGMTESVQAGCGAHRAPCSVGTVGLSWE